MASFIVLAQEAKHGARVETSSRKNLQPRGFIYHYLKTKEKYHYSKHAHNLCEHMSTHCTPETLVQRETGFP